MRGTFAPKLFFVRPWGALANKLRMISEQFYYWAFLVRQTSAWATILRMKSVTYPPSAHLPFFVRFLCALRAPWRLNREWNTNNILYLRNTVVFCSPGRPIWRTKYECEAPLPQSRFLFASLLIQKYSGSRPSTRWHDKIFPGEQNTNDFRTLNFFSVFWSPYRCLGDHFTNGIRNISTFGTLSFFVCFLFVLRAPWRLNGERNTNNFLYLRNSVVFCSPGRPIWRTKYECGALSPRSRFLFAIQAPWRLKYEWKNTVAQWSFLVRISSACLRMRIFRGPEVVFSPEVVFCSPFRRHGTWNTSEKIQSPNDRFWCVYQVPVCECVFHSGRLRYAFPPNDICALAPKELRIRPEGVTHSPRMIYAFAPKVLHILPEGVTHSPRRCYAFVWANKIRPFVLLGKLI